MQPPQPMQGQQPVFEAPPPPELNEVQKKSLEEARRKQQQGQIPTAPTIGNYQSDVVATPQVNWLWRGYVPAGALSIFQGQPGTAKSLTTVDLAARITTGRPMPLCAPGEARSPGGVLILSSEDSRGHIIKPRLEVAGADTSRVYFFDRLVLPRDVDTLEKAIADHGILLAVFDPFSAFLGRDINQNSEQDHRLVSGLLTGIGERTGCTFIAIRHLNKSEGMSAMNRGLGSVAGSAACRGGLHFGEHPDDPDFHVAAPLKWSYAGKGQYPSLRFSVRASTDNPDFPVIDWEGTCFTGADELVAPPKATPKIDQAVEIIQQMLDEGNGRVKVKDLEARMKEEGISDRTKRRAKKVLNTEAKKEGDEWYCCAPA